MHTVTIYCDGSSIGNPGPGGWGAVITRGDGVVEHGGYDRATTNNRMELTAAIESLTTVAPHSTVIIHTDSSYVINGITKWVKGWEKNGWQTKEKKDVLNKDLWQALVKAASSLKVSWQHVRGHSGVRLNERVDMIANAYARGEAITLFSGTNAAYETFLSGLPKARTTRPTTKKTGKAYSYVSCVAGKVKAHKTWAECEARVKGKKGVRYKKVFSPQEEKMLMNKWSA